MVKLQGRVIMYLCYDEAVQVGLNAYHRLEYAESCRSAFRVASREFKEYMEDLGLPYSHELAQQWINESKEHWNNSKFKSSRKAMSVLDDVMDHGCVTTSLQTKIKRTPPYSQLPNWSRTLLNNYLATLTCTFGTLYLTQIRNACSRFFLFLEFAGISQPSEITHEVVISFFIKDIHISSKAKDRCNNEISQCLLYIADQRLIPKTVGLALNKFVIPELIIVAELPESERTRFSGFFNTAQKDISMSKTEYDAAAKQLTDIHKSRRYSSNIRKSDLQAIRDFKVFMDANSFAYSSDLAL